MLEIQSEQSIPVALINMRLIGRYHFQVYCEKSSLVPCSLSSRHIVDISSNNSNISNMARQEELSMREMNRFHHKQKKGDN